MNKKLRTYVMLGIILVLTLSLAACGGNSGSPAAADPEPTATDDTAAPATEETSTDNTADAAEDAAEAEQVDKIDLNGETITLDAWWDPTPTGDSENSLMMLENIKKVEEKYNVKIAWTMTPWGENVEKLTTSVLAGDPYTDIIRLERFQAIPSSVEKGLLQPLDDVTEISTFDENIRAVGSYKGKMYGFLTENLEGTGLFYNKAIFKRDGLPDLYELQEKGEWTWEKFEEVARMATKQNADGTASQYGIASNPRELAFNLVLSNNSHIVDENEGAYVGNKPDTIEALVFMQKLFQNKLVAPGEGDDPLNGSEAFKQGKAAMKPGSSWEGGDLNQQLNGEVGFVFFPKGPKASSYVAPSWGPNMWYLAKGANPHTMTIFKELHEGIPPDAEGWKETQFTSEEDGETWEKMRLNTAIDIYTAFGKVQQLWEEGMNKIATGEVTPDSYVESIKAEAQADMDQLLKK